MALISMAVHDLSDNKRTEFTEKTINSLRKTVDFSKNRLFVIDNNSCEDTKDLLQSYLKFDLFTLVTLKENIGTAEALNVAWKLREKGEHCIKIDNDIVINSYGWIEEMEKVVKINPMIGQVGLKRKDLMENPSRTDWFKSELEMLPHENGDRWVVIEKCNHIIGSCVLHSSDLLDKVGFLRQPGLYGFDDSFMSQRSRLAGFTNCFLPHIDIDHIDPGGTLYAQWKHDEASAKWDIFHEWKDGYNDGTIDLYYNPFTFD